MIREIQMVEFVINSEQSLWYLDNRVREIYDDSLDTDGRVRDVQQAEFAVFR